MKKNNTILSFLLAASLVVAVFGEVEEIRVASKLADHELAVDSYTYKFQEDGVAMRDNRLAANCPYTAPYAGCFVSVARPPSTEQQTVLTCYDITDLFSSKPTVIQLDVYECPSLARNAKCEKVSVKRYRDFFVDENRVCISNNRNNVCLGKGLGGMCDRFYDVSVINAPQCAGVKAVVVVGNNEPSLGELTPCRSSYIMPVRKYSFEKNGFDSINRVDFSNLPTNYVAGVKGKAVHFNPGQSSTVSFPNGIDDFTLAFYIRTTTTLSAGSPWYNNPSPLCVDIGGQYSPDLCLYYYGNQIGYNEGSYSFADMSFTSNFPINDGNWHHVAITKHTGTNAVIKIYVDGKVKVQQIGYTGARADGMTMVLNAIAANLNFDLDELEIYDIALSQKEISSFSN